MRTYVCQDCGVTGVHEPRVGFVPQRCDSCKGERERERQRTYHAGRTPAQAQPRPCVNCGARHTSHSPYCADCRVARQRQSKAAYKLRNRERVLAVERERARRRYALDPEFAERQREYQRTRNGTPTVKAIRKRHYWKNPEGHRARRRLAYNGARRAIYERDEGICHICGIAVDFEDYEIDHIVPVSRGGGSEPENLATSHRRCNRKKAARLLEELTYA